MLESTAILLASDHLAISCFASLARLQRVPHDRRGPEQLYTRLSGDPTGVHLLSEIPAAVP